MISIRTAEIKDSDALTILFRQLGYQNSADSLQTRMADAGNDMQMLVAEGEAGVCGVIVMNFILPVHEAGLWALISALVVDESARGAGTGQRLLAEAERIAAEKNCTQIELSSSERRERAHKFYESQGYSEVRKRFVKLLSKE